MKLMGIRHFLVLSLLFLQVACETKEYQETSKSVLADSNHGKFFSDISFGGMASVNFVTDTSVIVSWVEVSQAIQYEVYIVRGNGNELDLYQRLNAPASGLTIYGLEPGSEYNFVVRARDESDLLDNNSVQLSATTLSSPLAPRLVTMISPLKTSGADSMPVVQVSGINLNDTVIMYYQDGGTNCGVELARKKLTTTSGVVLLESLQLTSIQTYDFYFKKINYKGQVSACSSTTLNYNFQLCPSGYSRVLANDYLNQKEFCVMKYEAKAWIDFDNNNSVGSSEVDADGCNESECSTKNWGLNNFSPGSGADGLPWRMITIDQAKKACQSLGPKYDLISNNEWMAVSVDVEAQPSNWDPGIDPSSKCLKSGNTGVNRSEVGFSCSYKSLIGIEGGATRDISASMLLASGDSVWDLSGNVAEWVDYAQDSTLTYAPTFCTDSWSEITSEFCLSSLNRYSYMPWDPIGLGSSYDSSMGIGRVEGGTGGVMVRGGSYGYQSFAGVFSMSLMYSENNAREDIGFRCVYRSQQ